MRILRLDLLRFGPFTDVSLPLDQPLGTLQIVYGPNEAGKSSALRALRQFFFGIPHNSADNFRHTHADLRIGGALESAAGERLECIRRKTLKQPLRAANDQDLVDPARLKGFLGGIDQQVFHQRFAIDYEELVQGGKAVARGEGDLGEILFAAASGVADLNQIRRRLSEEADALFKGRGSAQKINKALAELTTARQALRAAQLSSTDWDRHQATLQQALARVEQIDRLLLGLQTESSRLARIHSSLALIGRRRQLLDELAALADVPPLSDDFAPQRQKVASALEAERANQREADLARQRLGTAIEQLQVPSTLLQHASAIQRLQEELGSHRKAVKDRSALVLRRQECELAASQILRDLGREPELAAADSLRLTRAERGRIQELATQRGELLARSETANRRAAELRREREQVQRDLDTTAETRDIGPLRRALRRAGRLGDIEAECDRQREQLERARQQAGVELQRLGFWSGTLAELEQLRIPVSETIERFDREIQELTDEQQRLRDRQRELSDRIARNQQELAKLRLQQDVPTEEDLLQARRLRDQGWRLVRANWQPDATPDAAAEAAFARQFAAGADLAAAYAASVEQADDIADRLRREARHVTQKAHLIAEAQQLAAGLHEVDTGLQRSRSQQLDWQQRWQAVWQPLGIEPATPREMLAWSQRHAQLAARAASLRDQQRDVSRLENELHASRAMLSACLGQLGEPACGDDEPLACVLQRGDELVAQIQKAHDQRHARAQKRDELCEALAAAELAIQEAAQRFRTWQQAWDGCVRRITVSETAGPAEVNAVLEAITDLQQRLTETDDLRQRVDGIDRDAAAFRAATRQLVELAAPDLAALPVDQAASDLQDRLRTAQQAHARRQELETQREIEVNKHAKAGAQLARLQAEMERMCREAHCSAPDELPAAEQLSLQKRTRQRELRLVQDQLTQLAAGAAVEDLIAAAEQVDADQLLPTVSQIEDQIQQLQNDRNGQWAAIGQQRNELQRMDGSGQAADANEVVENLLSGIRSDVEQYARLRLASAVLQRAVERYRAQHQGPVLARAGRLFAELTLGSFDGLRADYNDQGEAVLVGLRPNQQMVGIEGMSDGTRDQLYLALRLASLEKFLAEREPLPFIVDDILIMFDDARAAAALRALADLAQKTQVVFFTHHRHVVELAESSLPAAACRIHTLDRCVIPAAESREEPIR